MILRVISHNRLEEGHCDDRWNQYRPAEFLHEQLAQASPDLMRELLATFVNALLGADADAVCGATYGSR